MNTTSPARVLLASVLTLLTAVAVAGCTGTLRRTGVSDECFNGTFENDHLLLVLVERQGSVAGSGYLFPSASQPRRTVELSGFVERPGAALVRIVVRSLPPHPQEARDLGLDSLLISRIDGRCDNVLFAFGINPEAGPFERLGRRL